MNDTLQYCIDYLTGQFKLREWKNSSENDRILWGFSWIIALASVFALATVIFIISEGFPIPKELWAVDVFVFMQVVMVSFFYFTPIVMVKRIEKRLPNIQEKNRENIAKLRRYILAAKLSPMETIYEPKILNKKNIVHPEFNVPLQRVTMTDGLKNIVLYAPPNFPIGSYIRTVEYEQDFVKRWYP